MNGPIRTMRRGGRPGQLPLGTARYRDILLVVLTLTTGALDAVTFLRLGNVFSSVITGNLVLLGVAAGKHDAGLALNAGLALAGYTGGVLAGAALAGTPELDQPVWPVQVTRTLAVESGVLAAFSGEWLAVGGHPAGAQPPWRCCCSPRPRWACRAPRCGGWARCRPPT